MKKKIYLNEEMVDVDILDEGPKFVLFNLDGTEYMVNLNSADDYKMHLSHNNVHHAVVALDASVVVDGLEFCIDTPKRSRGKGKALDHGQMVSPMPGKILKILVAPGAQVEAGTPLLVMEAMKMEHTIKAAKAGVVEKIFFKEGDQVSGGVELVKLC